jgi:cell wall-associated NlpC family hydrolase
MKKLLPIVLLLLIAVPALAESLNSTSKFKEVVQRHLGKPYVWGSSGLKSFDCSGFIWRVMMENGIMTKRTTARKFYMMLPKIDESNRWKMGTMVFFDNLKHVGIVDTQKTFYHAQVSRGTNLSPFDPFWRPKVVGFRGIPLALE